MKTHLGLLFLVAATVSSCGGSAFETTGGAADAGNDSGAQTGAGGAAASTTVSSGATTSGGGGVGGTSPTGAVAHFDAAVDFGPVDCGGAAPADHDFTVKNQGIDPLTVSIALSSTPAFSIQGGANATVAPGKLHTFKIAALAVPPSATAGGVIGATLTLKTNDPAHKSVSVPVTITPSGATLVLNPSSASFGLLPVGQQAVNVPLTLKNVGNASVTLTFAAPGDTQFALSYSGAPAPAVVQAGASVPGLVTSFKPVGTSPSVSSSIISTNGAICGVTSVTTIPMSGQGSNGTIGLSTTDLYFGVAADGLVLCGKTAQPKSFIISNSGNLPFTWSGALGLGAGSNYVFSPQGGSIDAGQMMKVTVTPAAVPGPPATTSTKPDFFADTLTITTMGVAGDVPHDVHLHETAAGAVLVLSPGSIDFGDVAVGTPAKAPLSVVNKGNTDATITLYTTTDVFGVSPGVATTVAGAGTQAFTASFTPGDTTTQTSQLGVTVAPSTTLCAPAPGLIPMTGTGSNGSVAFSPSSLDFSSVACGSVAPPQVITFSNAGNQSYTISASLGAMMPSYTLTVLPANGVVAPNGGTATLTVTPKPIPQTSSLTPNFYGDTLTVTTNVPKDQPHTFPLTESAKGSILTFSGSTLAFGATPKGSTKNYQFSIANSGNVKAVVNFTGQGQPKVFVMPQGVQVDAFGTSAPSAQFIPTAAQGYGDTATISVAPGTVLCQPLAFPSITLSGTGTNTGVVDVSPDTLFFGSNGFVACGTGAKTKSVTVTNSSNQMITATPSLGFGNGTHFSVSPPSGMLAANGGTQVFTVTPVAIPQTASTKDDAFGDVLTISTTAQGDAPHTVALHQTAFGAVLAFSTASMSFPFTVPGNTTTQGGNFTLQNSGNAQAAFTFALSDTTNYSVSPTKGTVLGNNNLAGLVTYQPASLGTHNATLGIDMNNVTFILCAPLPQPISITNK